MGTVIVVILILVVLILVIGVRGKIDAVESQITQLKFQVTKLSTDGIKVETKVEPMAAAKIEVAPEPIVETTFEPIVEPIVYADLEVIVEGSVEAAAVSEEVPEPVVEDGAFVVDAYTAESQTEVVKEEVKQVETVKSAPIVVQKQKPRNVEKYIGENLFGKIGILVLVVGIGLFVKYAIDNEWLSETMRTVLGFVVGGALLFVGERLSKKYRMFSSLLAGGGFAIFYVTVAVAYHYYAIFSQPVAFSILVAITASMIALSLLYNRRELAIIALAGGFSAPFIVSSGSGNYVVLFSYIAILCIGMFILAIKKRWSELPIICFSATYLIMLIFTATSNVNYIGGGMLAFATLFYLIFLLPVIYILRSGDKVNWTLLSLVVSNNFVFLGFGLYFLSAMPLSVNLDGVLTLFVASVNLAMVMWIMRYRKDRRELVYSMLGLVLSFVSLAIPLQLDGNYITLFWATEIVILLWLFVKSKLAIYNYFALGLMSLTLFSLIMDFAATDTGSIMFFNARFATNLYTALCFVATGIMIGKRRELFDTKGILPFDPFNIGTLSVGAVIAYESIMSQFRVYLDSDVAHGVGMIFSILYVLGLVFLCGKRFKVSAMRYIYIVAIGVGFFFYLGGCFGAYSGLMFWILTASWAALATYGARKYLRSGELLNSVFNGFMVYLNILVGIVWLIVLMEFASQIGIHQHSAEFSIALALLGTVQMVLGMKYHLRVLRIISVIVLSVVILKLALYDLWLMNSAGKIVVFISFGAILLSLSFLYQKLKDVLFSKDEK